MTEIWLSLIGDIGNVFSMRMEWMLCNNVLSMMSSGEAGVETTGNTESTNDHLENGGASQSLGELGKYNLGVISYNWSCL